MKIKYDKKGIKVIGIAFFLSVVINMWIQNSYSFFIIPYTIGVLLPYFLLVIITFLYYLVKKKELFVFSDSRVAFFFAFFELILIYNHLSSN